MLIMSQNRPSDLKRAAFVAFMEARNLKPAAWAKAADLSDPNIIYNYRKGRSQSLSQETLESLAQAAGVSIEEMFGASSSGNGRRSSDDGDHTQPTTLSAFGDEYAAIPRWRITAGAGSGNVIVPEPDAPYRLLFRAEWLRRITDAPLDEVIALEVAGNSMEPSLMPGDLVLADKTKTERNDESIFVVLDGDEVKIKRVLRDHATGGLILRSDNPAVKDLPPAPADVRQIVGRVFWVGRTL
ncbi:MAG: S24 family peptidase [Rhodospirillales bacterium]